MAKRRGENTFQAHRSHLYQRLVIAGYSHRTVTLLYSGLTLIGVALGLGLGCRRTRQRGKHPRVGPQLASGAALVCP